MEPTKSFEQLERSVAEAGLSIDALAIEYAIRDSTEDEFLGNQLTWC